MKKYEKYDAMEEKDFYEKHLKSGCLYDPVHDFAEPIKTRKHYIQMPYEMWHLILKTYFKVYYNDLFFKLFDSYFYLSGRAKLCQVRAVGKRDTRPSIVWYQRPSFSHFEIKLTGCSRRSSWYLEHN